MSKMRSGRIYAGCLALTNSRLDPRDNGKLVRVVSRVRKGTRMLSVGGVVFDMTTTDVAALWVVRSLGSPFLSCDGVRVLGSNAVYGSPALIPLGDESDCHAHDWRTVGEVKPKARGKRAAVDEHALK